MLWVLVVLAATICVQGETIVPASGMTAANCPGCTNAWQVTNGQGANVKSYVLIQKQSATTYWYCQFGGYTYLGIYIGNWGGTWQSCMFPDTSWIPDAAKACYGVSCGSGCTVNASILYDDIVGVFPWSGQCRWLCSRTCTAYAGSYAQDTYYRCGDYKTTIGLEQCDDGNNADGDGCSKFCSWENPCATNNGGCSALAECNSYRGIASCRCPANYIGNDPTCTQACAPGTKSYVISPNKLLFNEARAYCQSIDLFLANVTSSSESTLIKNAMVAAGVDTVEGWIGLLTRYKEVNDGGYEWIFQDRFPNGYGKAPTYTQWAGGAPTAAENNYAYVTSSGNWAASGDQYRYAVCEKACGTTCPNGVRERGEECDDNNSANGDGCSSKCLIEPGYSCSGSPSVCSGINYCNNASAVCVAGATCTYSGPGAYTCTCPSGYSGDGKVTGGGCNEINRCLQTPFPCNANAACTKTGPGTFSCACNSGYTGDGTLTGTGCTAINNCTLTPAPCVTSPTTATCTSTGPGTYTCSCPSGYSGNGKTAAQGGNGCTAINYCNDPNACVNISTGCNFDGPGQFTCFCPTNYTGDGKTNGTKCTPIDPCPYQPCAANAVCTYTGPNQYSCSCPTGYNGDGRKASVGGTGCTEIDKCLENPCSQYAICTKTGPGTFKCSCPANYTGLGYSANPCVPVNKCNELPAVCVDVAVCTYLGPGDYNCTCPKGQYGDGKVSGSGCNAFDPCGGNNCSTNGYCTFTGTYPNFVQKCNCNNGYNGDGLKVTSGGTDCTPINLCTSNNPCVVNATCTYTGPGTASCACNQGFNGTAYSPGSCDAVNRCNDQVAVCDSNATCTYTGPGTYSCSCNQGYSGNGQPKNCSPINLCSNSSYCDKNAKCTYTGPGSATCACNSGYRGNGKTCTEINPCVDDPNLCVGNATCVHNGPGTYVCNCNSGYTGVYDTANALVQCDELNLCNVSSSPCANFSTCTFTGPGQYVCPCAYGYEGSGTTVDGCTPINVCSRSTTPCVAGASCQFLGPNEFNCLCPEGYSGNGREGPAPYGCTTICGDGKIISPEGCDDNNTASGDGCSSTCVVERGFTCTPSINSLSPSFLISSCAKTQRPSCNIGTTFSSFRNAAGCISQGLYDSIGYLVFLSPYSLTVDSSGWNIDNSRFEILVTTTVSLTGNDVKTICNTFTSELTGGYGVPSTFLSACSLSPNNKRVSLSWKVVIPAVDPNPPTAAPTSSPTPPPTQATVILPGDNSNSQSDSSSATVGGAVGGTIAAIVIVVIVVLLLWFFVLKRKVSGRRKDKSERMESREESSESSKGGSGSGSGSGSDDASEQQQVVTNVVTTQQAQQPQVVYVQQQPQVVYVQQPQQPYIIVQQ
eukprot:TRINITY_DN574_c0_g1_i3.p1 TRINITY_DN574_c0_g1~~TRINITY_DN574_c0_g1_i3.p1  ORF type:complete len:1370 (-),score=377.73 TRINITY_DN574_c0_g1_i3:136-4245(-)